MSTFMRSHSRSPFARHHGSGLWCLAIFAVVVAALAHVAGTGGGRRRNLLRA